MHSFSSEFPFFQSIFSTQTLGSYAIRGRFFDVLLPVCFGTFGYLPSKAKFPMAPIVLWCMFEGEYRRARKLGGGAASVIHSFCISECNIYLLYSLGY